MKKIFILISVFLAGLGAGLVISIKDILLEYKDIFLNKTETKQIESLKLPKKAPEFKPEAINQLINIDTTVVKKIKLFKKIETYADIKYPEDQIKEITLKFSGYVKTLYADFEGKYIKKGQPLLSLYSPELVSAQEEFLRAYRYYLKTKNIKDNVLKESAKQMYLSALQKLKYWDMSESQINLLKKRGRIKEYITVYAPFDGYIIKKNIFVGSFIKEGMPIFQIAKKNKVWLIAYIYEKDIPFIKEGETVDIRLLSFPDIKYKGKIDYVYPSVDLKTRTLKVRISVENKDNRLLPGAYSKIKIKIPLGERLVLPETAVLDTGKRKVVFWEKEKGVFEPVFVKTGIYTDGFYEIREGLHEGMVVANSALFLLDADAQLKGKYSKEKPVMMHHHH